MPAFQGAKLAVDQAVASGDLPLDVQVVPQDVGDPARMAEVLADDAADPSYVGAIVSPFWSEPVAAGDRLSAAGVPTVSLSAIGPARSGSWRSWYSAVAPLSDQAAKVADWLARSNAGRPGVCLATDGSPYGSAFVDAVATIRSVDVLNRSLIPSEEPMPSSVEHDLRTSGCGALVYGGFGSDAGLIRIELDAIGLSGVRLVGSDAMRDRTFLEVAGSSADGTVASCSCVDLGADPALPGQQFIHDYQSEFGGPPASYAVEGSDVARFFVSAIHSGATTRSGVARFLASQPSFAGLAHPYAFGASGHLAGSEDAVHVFAADAGRWLPARASGA